MLICEWASPVKCDCFCGLVIRLALIATRRVAPRKGSSEFIALAGASSALQTKTPLIVAEHPGIRVSKEHPAIRGRGIFFKEIGAETVRPLREASSRSELPERCTTRRVEDQIESISACHREAEPVLVTFTEITSHLLARSSCGLLPETARTFGSIVDGVERVGEAALSTGSTSEREIVATLADHCARDTELIESRGCPRAAERRPPELSPLRKQLLFEEERPSRIVELERERSGALWSCQAELNAISLLKLKAAPVFISSTEHRAL